jgi:hypothetical protein
MDDVTHESKLETLRASKHFDLRFGVVGDGFGHVERGRISADVVGADFAFRDDAGNRRFQASSHFGFLQPVEHQFRGRFLRLRPARMRSVGYPRDRWRARRLCPGYFPYHPNQEVCFRPDRGSLPLLKL